VPSELPQEIAATILDGFDKHYRLFRQIAAEAKGRFERAEWKAALEASRSRIDFYDQRVREATAAVLERFPAARTEAGLWPRIKKAYIGLLYDHRQPECAETFYNSVACRVLARGYYKNENIFWRPAVSTEFIEGEKPTYRCYYPAVQGMKRTLQRIIADCELRVPFEDLGRDLRFVLRALRAALPRPVVRQPNFQVQVLSSLFYRNKGAYLVGRIVNGVHEQPFAVALRHASEEGPKRLCLDALLLDSEHISSLFSLARAYFLVEMDVPSAYVAFLKQLMPQKPVSELYTAVGLQKQGKTLFYRNLQDHLKHSTDQFVVAPGARGMVMMVFTLPSYPYVFKLIRDTFEPPKQTSREEVRGKYLLVKHHDRVGRMADTLEYSDVAFPISRIEPGLLQQLRSSCAQSLAEAGDQLLIHHLYIERRMVPLDLYVREPGGPPEAAEARLRRAIGEYGRAIQELAGANIFPGDLFLKNFGINRWGRVVFYDYDEIQYLTDLQFRRLPAARDDGEETAGEAWFYVGPHDIFPSEFPTFLFTAGRQRELFQELHGELADPAWWQAQQEIIRSGKQPDLFPYPDATRFCVRFA
jgi:isocitrate dehydrogenase kinase/phosphatase